MKKLLTLLGIILLIMSVSAEPVESLIQNENWGFWIKPEFKLTKLSGEWANLPGIQFGPALGHTLYLGVGGYALVNSVDTGVTSYKPLKAFDLWYAGVTANYTLLYSKLVHGSLGFLLGGGQLNVNDRQEGSDNADLFVADPGVTLMVNLTPTLELGVEGSYRFVNGSSFDNLSNSDLSGLTGSIFLRWTED